MAGPFDFLGDVSPEITAIGDFASGIGGLMQGQEQQAAYDYNASILQQQADQELYAGSLNVEEIGIGGEELLSTQKAMYAKAGVTQSGSPTDVALQTATNIEFDKQVANYNAQVAAANKTSQAQVEKYYGKQQAQKGVFDMATNILKGAAVLAIA